MKVAAVVLAAGSSSRLGELKQLVRLGSENLLERAVRVAREAGCSPVVVVLGASASIIQRASGLEDAVVVVNEGWVEGMGASIRVGVQALRDVDGCLVMTCDMPTVTASHLRGLLEEGSQGEVVAFSYSGRKGVPAYFPAAVFAQLMELHGDVGARAHLQSARCVGLVGGELDVDTLMDLRQVRELFG